jgi:hypothetical protein
MSIDLSVTYVRCAICGARTDVPAREAREAVAAR